MFLTSLFLSLSFSLPYPLSKNKELKKKKVRSIILSSVSPAEETAGQEPWPGGDLDFPGLLPIGTCAGVPGIGAVFCPQGEDLSLRPENRLTDGGAKSLGTQLYPPFLKSRPDAPAPMPLVAAVGQGPAQGQGSYSLALDA